MIVMTKTIIIISIISSSTNGNHDPNLDPIEPCKFSSPCSRAASAVTKESRANEHSKEEDATDDDDDDNDSMIAITMMMMITIKLLRRWLRRTLHGGGLH